MDDIARRAGVAKGTIYLNFKDKEALFEAILQQEIRPQIDIVSHVAASGGSLRDFLQTVLLPLLDELLNPQKGAVLRLLIGEAGRFPKLAEVYYRTVIEPVMQSVEALVRHSLEQGEAQDAFLLEFPQMLMFPILFAVIWTGLFQRFRQLDAGRMATAYFERLFMQGPTTKEGPDDETSAPV